MDGIPPFTRQDVRRWAGSDANYTRGLEYFNSGALCETRRQGAGLRSQCRGSQPQPYDVTVTFGPDGNPVAHCTCPVGEGGVCKHAIALMLAWLDRPDEFIVTPGAADVLRGLGRDRLEALVQQMLEIEPGLDWMLDEAVQGGAGGAGGAGDGPNAESFRRRATWLMQRNEDAFGGTIRMLRALAKLIDDARVLAQSNPPAAAAVYSGVLVAICQRLSDEEGDALFNLAGDCVEELLALVQRLPADDPARLDAWAALLTALASDADLNALGSAVAIADAIASQATPHEKHELRDLARLTIDAARRTSFNRDQTAERLEELLRPALGP